MTARERQAESIATAIAFYAPAVQGLAPFEWQPLVQAQRPGDATAQQKHQEQRIVQVRQALQCWAVQFALPEQHLHQSAYFAVVTTAQSLPNEQVLALAKTIFWIYVFDYFLDERLLLWADAEPKAQQTNPMLSAQVDRDIEVISTSLCRYLGASGVARHQRQANTTMLGEMFSAVRRNTWLTTIQGPIAPHPLSLRLSEALPALLVELDQVWQSFIKRRDDRTWRLALVSRQFARCIASMRREFVWSLQLANTMPKRTSSPSYSLYLANGAVSIGMYAVAAVAASFEQSMRQSWQRGLAAVDAGGRIIRLANDIATYAREAEEKKLTAVTLLLHELGYSPAGYDPLHSSEVQQAQLVLSHRLHHLLPFFAANCSRLDQIGNTPVLLFYLRHAVAFALSVYGDGSQYIETDGNIKG